MAAGSGSILFAGSPATPTAAPVATPVATPTAAPASTPVATPTPVAAPLTESEKHSLIREFENAQRQEMKGLKHRQSIELKELRATQSHRRTDWETNERAARHAFFQKNAQGAVRRGYIKNFIEKRKAFMQAIREETLTREKDHDAQISKLKDVQKEKATRFQEILKTGLRPGPELWPSPGV